MVVILGRFGMSPMVAGNGPNTSLSYQKLIIGRVTNVEGLAYRFATMILDTKLAMYNLKSDKET